MIYRQTNAYVMAMLKEYNALIQDAVRVGYAKDLFPYQKQFYSDLLAQFKTRGFLSANQQRILLDRIHCLQTRRYYYHNPEKLEQKNNRPESEMSTERLETGIPVELLMDDGDPYRSKQFKRVVS